MRTFKHPSPWIEVALSMYGETVTGLTPCDHAVGCRENYKNLEEACGGKRLLLSGEEGEGECPCMMDPEDRDRLSPKVDVIF